MARISVSLNDDLLKAMDAEVAESRTNRSALVQAALGRYLEVLRRERGVANRTREIGAACRGMDALAEKLGEWDPLPIIRETRSGEPDRHRRPWT